MKRRKKRTKKYNQRLHAQRRAYERYDKALTTQDLANIRDMIQNGESNYIRKLTNSRRLHSVSYNNEQYKVVYDKTRQQVCSFFEPDW